MKRRTRHSILTAFLVLGAASYVYFVHRSNMVKDADGWHLIFSYQPFHCRFCLGRVEVLTYKGAEIHPPKWQWKNDTGCTPLAFLATPVGAFEAMENQCYWRQGHHGPFTNDVNQTVSPQELKQGWYDATPTDGHDFIKGSGPFVKKGNTPAHWCLVATYDVARWLDPAIIGELSW